jgi:hypothetical protein
MSSFGTLGVEALCAPLPSSPLLVDFGRAEIESDLALDTACCFKRRFFELDMAAGSTSGPACSPAREAAAEEELPVVGNGVKII